MSLTGSFGGFVSDLESFGSGIASSIEDFLGGAELGPIVTGLAILWTPTKLANSDRPSYTPRLQWRHVLLGPVTLIPVS